MRVIKAHHMQAMKSLKTNIEYLRFSRIHLKIWIFLSFLSPSLRTRSVLLKVENEAGEDENSDEHDEKDQPKLVPGLIMIMMRMMIMIMMRMMRMRMM